MNLIKQSEGNVGIADAMPYRYERIMNYEQGTEGGMIQFTLECKDIPAGTKVGFHCGTPGPDPLIGVPATAVTGPSFVIGMRSMIPADFSGPIVYYADFTTTPPPTATLNLRAFWASPE